MADKAKKPAAAEKAPKVENRMRVRYNQEVVPYLFKHFNYKNVNQVPKLEKIVINAGLGDVKDNAKSFQIAVDEIKAISGQRPIITKARKSVANFKVREGQNIGCKVTLRSTRMYEFMDKLIADKDFIHMGGFLFCYKPLMENDDVSQKTIENEANELKLIWKKPEYNLNSSIFN